MAVGMFRAARRSPRLNMRAGVRLRVAVKRRVPSPARAGCIWLMLGLYGPAWPPPRQAGWPRAGVAA
jgi:hypothetical protein